MLETKDKKKVILKLNRPQKIQEKKEHLKAANTAIPVQPIILAKNTDQKKFGANKLNIGQFKAYKIASKQRLHKPIKKKSICKICNEVNIFKNIKLSELIQRMSENKDKALKILKKHGLDFKLNDPLDIDSAILITELFQHLPKVVSQYETIIKTKQNVQNLQTRPPIITVVGHVDHGKTSLLDAIRSTNQVKTEQGGITQSIGAYQVEYNNHQITFIDTPGHEAFIAMRACGINLTDIVLLVIAADDGIKEQTIESIKHIKAAGVPMIIVINKIDAPGANVNKVLNELLGYDLVSDKFNGGEILTVEVSAKNKTNIDKLLEVIILQAIAMDITADQNHLQGIVIESEIQKGMGITATVIIKDGQINIGDIFVIGKVAGKIRTIKNWQNKPIKCGMPGEPVLITGLEGIPIPGNVLEKVENIETARNVAKARFDEAQDQLGEKEGNDLMSNLLASVHDTFPIVLKAQNQGTLDAVSASLEQIAVHNINVSIVSAGIGDVTESDIEFAKVISAEIIGFNVGIQQPSLLQKLKVYRLIFTQYNIIYRAIDYVLEKLRSRIVINTEIQYTGQAEVIKIFKVPDIGTVIGCRIFEGIAAINNQVTVFRKGAEIYIGKIVSMQRDLSAVKSSTIGQECAIMIGGISGKEDKYFTNIELKDQLSFSTAGE